MIIRPPQNQQEQREVFGVLMQRPGLPGSLLKDRIAALEQYAQQRNLSLEHCLGAWRGGRIIASCLCLDTPGRISSILLCPGTETPEVAQGVIQLLQEAKALARQRNVQLLQGMVSPEVRHEGKLYRQAGFEHLAKLIYQECNLTKTPRPPDHLPAVQWIPYDPGQYARFAEIIEKTYQDSLDCGSLNGRRQMDDILESHRATGRFNPRHWMLACVDQKAIGAMLLAHVPEQDACEVVYIGLLPEARRRGLGKAMLYQAAETARAIPVDRLTLSVDEKNKPARRLYSHFGFQEIMRRDVWLCELPGPDA